MEIKGEKIVLVPIKPEEKDEFYKLAAESEGSKFWYSDRGLAAPTREAFFQDWRDGYFDTNLPEKGQCFWITVDGEKIGQINYNEIDLAGKQVELDIIIGSEKNMGKGYGTDSLKILIKYLFDNFAINKIWIEPRANNSRAIKAYEKAGFKKEGNLVDKVKFVILRSGFLEKNDLIQIKNLAFVDGQNLYMNTAKKEGNSWKVDLARFRVYLEKKYNVDKAYYFLGYVQETNQELYEEIQNAGFILVFREHSPAMIGKKKGNVDSDIIFNIMKRLYRQETFNKVILVSGDGDYKLLVDFLIEENKFEKILFPDRKYRSSLYKELSNNYFAYLDDTDIKNKIAKQFNINEKRGALGS